MYGNFKIFSGSSHKGLAERICHRLGMPLGKSKTVQFSNENLLVQIEENVREADVFVIQTAAPPLHQNIFEMFITIDALKGASAARVTAVLPYMPYVRSDKKDRPRISITARLMADLLEACGADRVLTMDLHAPQIQGFFRKPTDQLQAAVIICKYLARSDLSDAVLIAADAGEAKDLGRYAQLLDLPIAIIDKRRDGDDENPRAVNLIGDVKGKTAIIIDDEIASAGTIIKASEFLYSEGATSVKAAATHAVFSGTAMEKIASSRLTEVIVTDTVPVPPEKRLDNITVLSGDRIFASAIQRIHDGNSVSSLFKHESLRQG